MINYKQKIELIDIRILGIFLVVAATTTGIFAVGFQTVSASICPPMCVDVDVDEAEMAGNNTNMTMMGTETNQTMNENMTPMTNNSTN